MRHEYKQRRSFLLVLVLLQLTRPVVERPREFAQSAIERREQRIVQRAKHRRRVLIESSEHWIIQCAEARPDMISRPGIAIARRTREFSTTRA